MAHVFKFQDPGEGIYEAEVIKILVSSGDQVREGQNVLLVETDKANFDVSCAFSGVVKEINIKEGDIIHVGDPLMTIAEAGAEAQEAKTKTEGPSEEDQEQDERIQAEKGETAREKDRQKHRGTKPPRETQPKREGSVTQEERPRTGEAEKDREAPPRERPHEEPPDREGPVPASPATRRIARELNVDLRQVSPTGEGGRVLTDDVRAFAERRRTEGRRPRQPAEEARPSRPVAAPIEAPPLPDFSQWGAIERKPLRSIRRETARRMALSWSRIPHVTHNDVADITELEGFRRRHAGEFKDRGGKLTLTVLVMKAVVAALHEYPTFNATLDPDSEELILKRYYHLGIALDSDRGLLVPVIRDVDRKSMSELAVELFTLAERVRQGNVNRQDMLGGTFTISNVGPMGGTGSTPIINYPEVAILGLARARLQPVVHGTLENPETVTRLMLPLSLAFDHRINDGADAARFVNKVIHTLTDLESFALAI